MYRCLVIFDPCSTISIGLKMFISRLGLNRAVYFSPSLSFFLSPILMKNQIELLTHQC